MSQPKKVLRAREWPSAKKPAVADMQSLFPRSQGTSRGEQSLFPNHPKTTQAGVSPVPETSKDVTTTTTKPRIAGVPIIHNPMDGEDIENEDLRYQAWKNLAVRRYNNQATCYARGKSRFDSIIHYDATHNVIRWNDAIIPGSKRLFSNEHEAPSKRLGKVILTLMVKNESRIIERALFSAQDDIDGFVILDTGSTDDTPQIMWNLLTKVMNKKGVIYLAPFEDFGTNRSILTQLAFERGDWLLLFDADYKLERTNKQWKQKLDSVSPDIAQILLYTTGNTKYARPHLVRGNIRWCYVCRTHEHLSMSIHNKEKRSGHHVVFDDVLIDHVGDGGCKYDKAPRDIVMLMMDLLDNPESERAYFYLGNSMVGYRNTRTGRGMEKFAIDAYHHAMNYGTWKEELIMSAYECQRAFMQSHQPDFVRVLINLMHGMFVNPDRLELPYHFLKSLRYHEHPEREWRKDRTGRHHDPHKFQPHFSHLAACLGSFYTHNDYPSDQTLFVDVEIHKYGFWEELIRACSLQPLYFRLGCYLSRRLMQTESFKQKPADQINAVKWMYQQMFEQPADKLIQSGAVCTPKLKKRLMEVADQHFGRQDYAEAKLLYEQAMQPVVSSVVAPYLSVQDLAFFTGPQHQAEKLLRKTLVDAGFNAAPHLSDPLTSWKSCRSTRPLGSSDAFFKREEILFQLGRCAEKLVEQQVKKDTESTTTDKTYLAREKYAARVVRLGYLIDCLKYDPSYKPALNVMYNGTRLSPSKWTRCVTYAMRLATASSIREQGTKEEAIIQERCKVSPLHDNDPSDLVLTDGTIVK